MTRITTPRLPLAAIAIVAVSMMGANTAQAGIVNGIIGGITAPAKIVASQVSKLRPGTIGGLGGGGLIGGLGGGGLIGGLGGGGLIGGGISRPQTIIRDHRKPPQVIVRDHRTPPPAAGGVIVRDHRTPPPAAPLGVRPR